MNASVSRGGRPGEAAPTPWRPGGVVRLAVASALALFACETGAQAQEGRKTPSGDPVPRYVVLKFGEVNARAGPGDDYRVLWTYKTRGLPLQVIAETVDWRRVCDPEGAVAWVHQRTVDSRRRMVMRISPEPLALRRKAEATSAPVAMLAGRSLAELESCKAGWCQIAAGRTKGWAPQGEIWGADDAPQCRSPIAPAPRR